MNILKLVVGVVMKKGGSTLVVWVVLMMATVMAYRLWGTEPLSGSQKKGMALILAILAILGVQVWRWIGRRRQSGPISQGSETQNQDNHAD